MTVRANNARGVVDLGGIRTCTPRMIALLECVERFAALDVPVLIQGETGTGKELVAQAVHALSPRTAKPLVTVHCGSLPESLIESELFGHERGAFTGADRPYAGRIEAALGGTLFLDEINSVSLPVQTKLLRFLDKGELCRIGRPHPVRADVRVISASNVLLEQLVAAGQMRADFFYRVSVLRLDLPPLRERPDDIRLLARQLLAEDPFAKRHGITDVTDELLAELQPLAWPGNVRELRNVLRRGLALAPDGGPLGRLDPGTDRVAPPPQLSASERRPQLTFRAWVREREREYLSDLVRRHRTVAERAAASGLPQRTLYRRVRSLGLSFTRAAPEVGQQRPPEGDTPAAIPAGVRARRGMVVRAERPASLCAEV